MQGRPRQMRNGGLQRIKTIVERQKRMLAEGDDDGLFLERQDCRARSCRPHRNVMDEAPLPPLRDRLGVQAVAPQAL